MHILSTTIGRISVLAGTIIFIFALTFGIHALTTPPVLPDPPLKTLAAQHGIELGNFAISSYLNDSRYSNILTSQFNLALIDNTPNWYFTDGGLRPTPSTFNFTTMDKVVAFAQAHHMQMQAHHLLWGESKWLPTWLTSGHYSPDQLMDVIHNHIDTVVGHYRGKIKEWTVVNEAFTRGQHIYGLHDWWADNTGSTAYIDQAFIWAHQADPQAKLILNDFDNEHFNPVSDAMYQYIEDAKARGVPIDGIGMQMHIDGTHPPDMKEVTQNMQRFGRLGVSVYVTEFDVNMSAVPAPDSVKDNIAAGIYYNMMRACINAGDCHSFSELGITDKETWYNYMGPSSADARPLMFDKKYKAKPAFYAFRNALLQK
ncbi:MAG TPA: endo-1,4-beta-xylanase [Candidatus Saccharimonadales bacterium]|nr:endo-1,4-beta-xylanase [Candidatus Saccharimonadales bacterium]